MKKTLLPFVLILFVSCVFLGRTQSLTREQERALTSLVLTNQEMVFDGREIQLDLEYSHEISTNNPEIRLVADDNGKKYVIWWVDTDNGPMIPYERQIATGDKKDSVGLCFNYGAGPFVFYEVNFAKALQEAKSTNSRVSPSGWVRDWTRTNNLEINSFLLYH